VACPCLARARCRGVGNAAAALYPPAGALYNSPMRAITVIPGDRASAELSDLPEPDPGPGDLVVEPLLLGVCGTDREIVDGIHGEAPTGHERLVLGHELLGRVQSAPPESEVNEGDLVAGIVRRPDPEPCVCCGRGEWDMCRNGRYTERGIKARDGYGAELVTLESDFAVRLDAELGELGVLTEPASILAKAWEQIDRIADRACAGHERALVTGAGPIGLLAAMMGVERGLDVHVLDRAEEGLKPDLVRELGASYHTGSIEELSSHMQPEIIVECTGVAQLVVDAMQHNAPGAIVCLTGVGETRSLTIDIGALNNAVVLENDVVFGSVNANRRHFEQARDALGKADQGWLQRLITRRVPLASWQDALEKGEDDIKTVVEFPAAASASPAG
jgi:threonine dehydrogenase-like Zn-dependent dehydrogenase